MTRFKRKPSKLFIKYLISYLAILLVPLLIIGFFGYSYIKSIDAEKVIDDDVDSLIEAVKTVDNYLEQISRIAFEMAGDQDLWGGSDKDDIRKILSNYSVPDKFVLKMFLYRRGDEVIHSSSGPIKLSQFITKIYNYEKWEHNDFYHSINTISSPTIRPGENVTITSGKTERYITYLLPLHSFTLQSHGIVLLLIPEESMFSILNNVLKGYKSNTIILNQQDKIITIRNKGSSFYYKLIDYVKLTPEYHNIETVVTKRQGYYIIYSTSGYSGWKYITITRSHEISSKVNRLKTTALYSLILIILIGGAAIGCFLNFNYNPIKKLKEYAEKRSITDENDTNEIDTIRSVIENISNQNVRLQSRIKSHEIAVKEYLLFSLLRGHIKNREEFNSRGQEIGLSFNRPLLFVVVFHMDKLNKIYSQDVPAVIDDLERSMPEEFGGYGRESIDGKRLIFVMCTEDNEDSVIAARLITCQKLLQEKWHISMSVGIGNRYAKYREIGKSYIEASTAVDYRFVIGKNSIILFGDIKPNRTEIQSYPDKEFDELEKHMLNGDTASIENSIISIIGSIKNNNLPLFLIKSICFDIIGIIRKALSNINEESSINIEIFHNVLSLTEFTTVDDLYDLMLTISTEICNIIAEKKEYLNSTLINRILHYIKDNYSDSNFSIQSVADYFEISVTNFSHFFKSHAECTFVDYTGSLRIEKAKRYLLDTDRSVKEIVSAIGYHDESSFIRKFRQIVGITPGKFRNEGAIS